MFRLSDVVLLWVFEGQQGFFLGFCLYFYIIKGLDGSWLGFFLCIRGSFEFYFLVLENIQCLVESLFQEVTFKGFRKLERSWVVVAYFFSWVFSSWESSFCLGILGGVQFIFCLDFRIDLFKILFCFFGVYFYDVCFFFVLELLVVFQ